MHFLLIETSTERGVIAYGNQHEIIFSKELPFGPSQSKFLLPYLSEALQACGDFSLLKGIGVGMGPGSYTGMRLGVSVAQGLAYSWKVPLIGVSSLEGFVPSQPLRKYTAILDARIGGVYFQTTEVDQEGVLHKSFPAVTPLEYVGKILKEFPYLITPNGKSLQLKLNGIYPDNDWYWEERSPSVPILLQCIEVAYLQGKMKRPPEHLDLLYLRKTEAEREKERKEC